MTVKELMSTSICFIRSDASLSQAAALMRQYNIGFIPVCDNKGALLGAVTDRDLITRTDFEADEPAKIPASSLMTKNLVTVSPDMDIHDAACLFSKSKVHRLPVVENGRLVGILTVNDLAKKRIYLAEVGDIMGAFMQ
ncbi:CBS domain-containing protein [Ihubacter sp. rT4E-8]|uniref:CBS domain-containing protein n=1 Tax=unclassified Ihubacter TaxID=2633299 RepID=UPI00137A78FB